MNILLLIPHPDDEVVGFSASLARARGASVFGLYLSHGCLAREVLWPWQRSRYEALVARRRAEAEEVARRLQITPLNWSARPARQVWRELPAVYAEVQNAIAAHAIDEVWLPAFEGGNADHDAANAIGARLRAESGGTLSVLEFAEYNFCGGAARAQEFPAPNGTEQILQLSPAEQAEKRALLRLYASERQNLNYVGTTREAFRPLASYDYSQPPHQGPLWYTRFQWVPFRHPRVDFTKPEAVAAAIGAFLTTPPSSSSLR